MTDAEILKKEINMNKPLSTGYPCTLFTPPDGDRTVADIKNMHQDDFDAFGEMDAKLSGEPLNGSYIFYADVGVLMEDDETPMEVLISSKEFPDPFDLFHELCLQAQLLLAV